MKLDELKKFIDEATNEESGIDYDSVLTHVNGESGKLADRKVETSRAKWETEYNTNLYKELGLEDIKDTSGLKSYIDERKEFNPEEMNSLNSKYERTNKELEIVKLGFNGDNDDLDYIIHKTNTMISAEEGLSYTDAVTKLKETKPSYFGQGTVITTGKPNNKAVVETISPLKEAMMKRNKRR